MAIETPSERSPAPAPEPAGSGGCPASAADAQCVAAVLGGDRERFGELVERYQSTVYSIVLGYVRDAQRAEDVSQEVFVGAFTNLAQLREPERFLPWLLQIARNRASREARRGASRPEQPLGDHDAPAREDDPDRDRAAYIFGLVEELPEPYRHTLLLKYKQGLSCKEIAQAEGVPVGTITSRLTRALGVLRGALGQGQDQGQDTGPKPGH